MTEIEQNLINDDIKRGTKAEGVDASLIIKARKLITGANLHDVRGLIARLEGHYYFINKYKLELDNYEMGNAQKCILRDRKYLMHFIQTGIVPTYINNYCGIINEN